MVNKTDLIPGITEELQKRFAITQAEVKLAVDALLDYMADSLVDGERIEIRGFGAFTVREIAPRQGRNPRTGEPVDVPAKRTVHFKAGNELREQVDQKANALQET